MHVLLERLSRFSDWQQIYNFLAFGIDGYGYILIVLLFLLSVTKFLLFPSFLSFSYVFVCSCVDTCGYDKQ